jgi:phosphonate transport system substrate-binding protein
MSVESAQEQTPDRLDRRDWLLRAAQGGAGLTGALAVPAGLSRAASAHLSVSVVPQFQPVELQRTWGPALERLEQELGMHFNLRIAKDIPSFEDDFKNGRSDLVFLNPYHMVMARKAQAYEPVVRDVTPLAGLLVVHKDDPIRSVQDLKGKDIAFPAPNAFGASLWIRALLNEQHKVPFQPMYARTHTNAYRQVLVGRAAAAGGIRATLDREPEEVRKQLRVLMETPAVPPHPLAVHPRVSSAVRLGLFKALERWRADPGGQALLQGIQMPRPVAANYARDFAPLEKLRLEKYVE